ncbi:MAG: ATP phosphoribosyltransferase [Lachnospiraceae bacterium]|nr:ATP phosphoribosyltransferase [Lachnospiraceae bacterium]
MKQMLNIALPKGRLGEKVYGMFAEAGFECPEALEESRKLFFENEETGVRYFWVKPSDVTVYVERGACDIGVAGKDIIMENEPDVYELYDLKAGCCRMSESALNDYVEDCTRTLRVATKFPNIATKYYSQFGRDVDIIKLNGSIELAPIVGLSDVIVDITETGTTLRENNMREFRVIANLSARLIANKANYEFKKEMIENVRKKLEMLSENKA